MHFLDKDIEIFKNKMRHEKNIEVEKLRAELNKFALEHQVKFNQLHIKVFVTIARLYRLIVAT